MFKTNHPMTRLPRTVARVSRLLLCGAVLALGTGCISAKSYVDTQLPKVAYSGLKTPAKTGPVQLLFEFQTKETTNAAATEQLRPKAIKVLEQSKLFSEVVVAPKTAERKLFVTINNFAVTKDAAAKGFGTGLTFGLVGTMVTDGYLMDAAYRVPARQEVNKTYRHAIHTTIGNASGPANVQSMTPAEAVDKALEELLLNFLNDLSHEGRI